MKPKPEELWNRLVNEADHSPSQASDDTVTSIVRALRWQPTLDAKPTWDEFLWLLILRVALPGATALFILAALLPAPTHPLSITDVDDLIAAVVDTP